ncbi:TVP38/TMEM64 family protein [Meiothermus sp. QL-1]|uniref:TVP38/TMEM64 family protein n=1 Tax=Meiothermus sp. QL-1 TaxID=2058095 RepID=UPI000E0C14A7|nr:VTT domain-containing protein [Meiothermus sp. QL-1]RDI96154.1 TVP38/TMEM64 family protein [Meiothermus sp. QL-1]
MERPVRKSLPLVPLLAGLLLLAGGLVGVYLLVPGLQARLEGLYQLLRSGDLEAIRAWVAGLGWVGPLSIIALMVLQTLVSVVPMSLVMLVSVLVFGPVVGGAVGFVGAVVAAMVGYGLARLLGPVVVDRLVSAPIRRRVEAQVERYGPWAIIALRFSLVVPTDSISFVAGLVRMHPLKFLLATAVGALPVTLLIAWLGSDFTRMGPFMLALSLLVLLGLAAWVLYERRRISAE